MKNTQKFQNFLESLKDGKHDSLIESVKQGFRACCEGTDWSIVNFTPALSVVVSADNEDAFLEKLEKRINDLDKSNFEYEIEAGDTEQRDVQPGYGPSIYLSNESPSLDVLVKTENPIELLGSIEDQMSNCVSENGYRGFSFKIAPKVLNEIQGNELRLRISLDIDESSVSFNESSKEIDYESAM